MNFLKYMVLSHHDLICKCIIGPDLEFYAQYVVDTCDTCMCQPHRFQWLCPLSDFTFWGAEKSAESARWNIYDIFRRYNIPHLVFYPREDYKGLTTQQEFCEAKWDMITQQLLYHTTGEMMSKSYQRVVNTPRRTAMSPNAIKKCGHKGAAYHENSNRTAVSLTQLAQ